MTRALLFLLTALLVGQPGAQQAPDFALKSITGENQRLSEQRGRVVLIAFWASWCRECPELLRMLQRLRAETADPDLQIFGVSVDHRLERAQAAAGAIASAFPILLDVKQDVAKGFQIETIPTVALVDRDGVLGARWTGAEVLSADYPELVEAALQE